MVIGVGLYKFELNMTERGEITPDFELKRAEMSDFYKGKSLNDFINSNEKFKIYYSLTTGSSLIEEPPKKLTKENILFEYGRLKNHPYHYMATYRKSIDENEYIIISLFTLDEDFLIYEDILKTLTIRMDAIFTEIAQSNLKNIDVVTNINNKIELELKFVLFQMDRLANLTKEQKVALIYVTPERRKILSLLRKGPISRKKLFDIISKETEYLNLDVALRPFVELNLIRRDWAKGKRDKRTSELIGQGEYIFLVRDVILVRCPPKEIINFMKENARFGPQYLEKLNEFYENYDPVENSEEESETLGHLILEPDMYDLIALLSNRSYMLEKMPKVISPFSDPHEIIDKLLKTNIFTLIKDEAGKEWLCLLCEIRPLLIFPTYLVKLIHDNYFASQNFQNIKQLQQQSNYDNLEIIEPLTQELAKMALDILESSYDDKYEF
ncbi:MAG: hypothetical protein ACTSRZ_14400 [Promethearchaeota archaeon]